MQDPRSTFFGKTFTGVPAGRRVVALTFDDGPNGRDTAAVLDVLAEESVHATFFVVGKAVEREPELLRRMVSEGHALGNHTWSHAHLNIRTREGIQREVSRTEAAIERACGAQTKLVRPPFGARSFSVLEALRCLGLECVLWSVPLAREWDRPGAETIARRLLERTVDGSILALHDGDRGERAERGAVAAATRLVIDGLRARGLRCVTVPEMLAFREAP